MKKQILAVDYKITSFLVNLRAQAGLYTILNLIQDAGWQHAIHWEVKLAKNLTWVFTRQKLMMKDWPKWNETVTIKTWLRPPGEKPFLLRDCELFVGDRKIGECTSTFAVMDLETRKLAPTPDWSQFSSVWRTEGVLEHQPEKINTSHDVVDLTKFEVRNSDIDLNRHVNNTRYAQWILDALPIEILREGVILDEYEVNFLAETKIGDVVIVQKGKSDGLENPHATTLFQGTRAADHKPVFVARLKTSHPS